MKMVVMHPVWCNRCERCQGMSTNIDPRLGYVRTSARFHIILGFPSTCSLRLVDMRSVLAAKIIGGFATAAINSQSIFVPDQITRVIYAKFRISFK